MAIDSVRLLTDSAAQISRRLAVYGSIEDLAGSTCFDEWLSAASLTQPLSPAEEQLLRRDYRRLLNLLEEIETLVRSRSRAINLVLEQAAAESSLSMR